MFLLTFPSVHLANKEDDAQRELSGVDGFSPDPFSTQPEARDHFDFSRRDGPVNSVYDRKSLSTLDYKDFSKKWFILCKWKQKSAADLC